MPREILIELLQQEPKLASETRRLESILRDRCGREKARINALVVAQREGVVSQLQGLPSGTPLESLLARLTRQIQDNVGLEEDLARWAVESWALALGVIRQPLVVAPTSSSPPVRTRTRRTVTRPAIESPPVRPPSPPVRPPLPTPPPLKTTPSTSFFGWKWAVAPLVIIAILLVWLVLDIRRPAWVESSPDFGCLNKCSDDARKCYSDSITSDPYGTFCDSIYQQCQMKCNN